MQLHDGDFRFQALMRVAFDDLRQALCLPEGVRIVCAQTSGDFLDLTIEHQDLPATLEFDALPEVSPLFSPPKKRAFIGWDLVNYQPRAEIGCLFGSQWRAE